MRISRIDIGVAGANEGLQASLMTSLGPLVVLAGPNGAGKSRILRAIKAVLSDTNLRPENVQHARQNLAHEKLLRAANGGRSPYATSLISLWERTVQVADAVTVEPAFEVGRVFEFFPKITKLVDQRGNSESVNQRAEATVRDRAGLVNLEQNTLSYISAVERRWFSATHPDLSVDPEQTESVNAFETAGLRNL